MRCNFKEEKFMKIYEGKLVSQDIKVGIVVARFNEFITSKLLGGAIDGLKRENVKEENIEVAWVPGAFEIPLIAKKMADSKKYDAIICLGAFAFVYSLSKAPDFSWHLWSSASRLLWVPSLFLLSECSIAMVTRLRLQTEI